MGNTCCKDSLQSVDTKNESFVYLSSTRSSLKGKQLSITTRASNSERPLSNREFEEGYTGEEHLPSPVFASSMGRTSNPEQLKVDTRLKLGLYEYEIAAIDEQESNALFMESFRIISTNQIYKGQWLEGKRHGQGELYEPDGSAYKGYWKNDMKSGKGKYIWSDGRVYTGEWKDDKMHGKGTIVWADGSKYAGDFVENRKEGFGEYEYINKAKYRGGFKADLMEGEGTYTSQSGRRIAVLHKNGERVRWY